MYISNKKSKLKIIKFINNKIYIKKRKNLLPNINNISFDNRQAEVILSEEDASLVLAPAGSGKSLTILGRIIYLVNSGVDSKDILVISFTNMASTSLKEKLKQNNIDMQVFTFHKLGRKILRENGYSVNLVKEDILYNIIKNNINRFNKLNILINKKEEIYNLNKLLYTFINLFKSNLYENFDSFYEKNKKEKGYQKDYGKAFLDLSKKIYDEYEYYLGKNKYIDFHDMINKSISVVRKKGIHHYKYIIVDEYQDTSLNKCLLLKEIKQYTNSSILVVGDDYQSIYSFTGSNLDIFLNFNAYFSYSKVFKLQNTYRNSNELIQITSKFILKNKRQIYKNIKSNKYNKHPIYIYYYKDNYKKILKEILEDLEGSVLVLGRNNKDILDIPQGMTVHKSKGLEADNVIIVNLENSIMGFPNKIVNNDVLKYVLNKESYPYEEERRLFYVALTRTKNSNYLLVKKDNSSVFVEELLQDNLNITKIVDF